jgi:tRNA(Ser,Leu) C12 N-acetylase TAN1
VLLPATADELAFAVAERLRRLVEQHTFSVDCERGRHPCISP